MIITVPTNGRRGLEETVADHFGRCATYTLLNEKGQVTRIIEGGHEQLPPQLLKSHGTNIVLCKSLGSKAIGLCNNIGIQVYISPSTTVEQIFKEWKAKQLTPAAKEDACD